MSYMKYESELYILTTEFLNGSGTLVNAGKPTEKIHIPVHSFEVEGGTNRKIDLKSTDDVSLSLEFEQARIYRNIIFYVPPTRDFLAVRLMELGITGELFDLTFVVSIYAQGRKLQTLRLSAESSLFRSKPMTVGGPPAPSLMVKVRMPHPKLLHGRFDPRFKRIIHKEI